MKPAQSLKPRVSPKIFKYRGQKHLSFLPRHTSKDDFCWIRKTAVATNSSKPVVSHSVHSHGYLYCLVSDAYSVHFPPRTSRQKPDNPGPHSGQTADWLMKTRSGSLSEILLADQKKKKGIKLNCRVGVFLKRLSGCRELNILSLHNY